MAVKVHDQSAHGVVGGGGHEADLDGVDAVGIHDVVAVFILVAGADGAAVSVLAGNGQFVGRADDIGVVISDGLFDDVCVDAEKGGGLVQGADVGAALDVVGGGQIDGIAEFDINAVFGAVVKGLLGEHVALGGFVHVALARVLGARGADVDDVLAGSAGQVSVVHPA
jgi:hypothetical protein